MAKGEASPGSVLYIPHGGGPLPLLGDPGHREMVGFLKSIPGLIPEPEAILVISAHWEEKEATVTGGPNPELIYDYHGFPEESYRVKYGAPGHPALAEEISRLLKENGISCRIDPRRGFDHGMFVPLKIIYPGAGIPTVQLSLVAGLDPRTHLGLGRALSRLLSQNLLVLGSGFSFHNLRAFFSSGDHPDRANDSFQEWLIETCASENISLDERQKRLIEWEKAAHARYCHPREEHLLPLHVCSGMADSPAKLVFDAEVIGKRALGLLWR